VDEATHEQAEQQFSRKIPEAAAPAFSPQDATEPAAAAENRQEESDG